MLVNHESGLLLNALELLPGSIVLNYQEDKDSIHFVIELPERDYNIHGEAEFRPEANVWYWQIHEGSPPDCRHITGGEDPNLEFAIHSIAQWTAYNYTEGWND